MERERTTEASAGTRAIMSMNTTRVATERLRLPKRGAWGACSAPLPPFAPRTPQRCPAAQAQEAYSGRRRPLAL
eukprot:1290856-Alexandrium_andersonii.AAC.1